MADSVCVCVCGGGGGGELCVCSIVFPVKISFIFCLHQPLLVLTVIIMNAKVLMCAFHLNILVSKSFHIIKGTWHVTSSTCRIDGKVQNPTHFVLN